MPITTAADNILKYFFFFFLFFIEKKSWHLIHFTHQADSSHEMSTYFLWKIKTKFRMRSAALFYLALYIMLCMLGNFACFFVVCGFSFKIIFFQKIFQVYYQNVKQFGFRSGPTKCWNRSGSKLFAKVLSRWQKSPPAGKELRVNVTTC